MKNLPLFHYGAIHADPAWRFSNWSKAGEKKNACRHYDCMSLPEIKALPVGDLAARDCALFLWVTDPMLQQGLEVMKAWGFSYKTVAFIWAKRSKTDSAWFMGCGYWTRANPEMCLMGTIGKPVRLSAAVRQLVVAPVREHSRKPDRIAKNIEALVAGPYLELFARTKRKGWDAWGNEAELFEEGAA